MLEELAASVQRTVNARMPSESMELLFFFSFMGGECGLTIIDAELNVGETWDGGLPSYEGSV